MLKDFLKRRVYNATGLLPLLFLLAACSALKPVDKVDRWEAYLYDVQRTNHAQAGLPVPLKTSWTRDISPFIILHRYPEEQASSPVLSGGALFIGSVNGRFYAFDARSGSLLWKFDSGYPVEAAAASEDGAVCFGSSGGVLRCLKAEDGTLVWIYQMKSEITSSPLIKDGRIYVSSADDRLTALDLKTGERIWSYSRSTFASVAPRIKASPALSPA
ncbi:MAG: PQQ-binding-like beta-propeller repeat protein, partial [Deltaproteobacteria bacterium]|nr:PQQ-binding-like beta-propeller repeat protein [Deltaproteobacteria bacterium]